MYMRQTTAESAYSSDSQDLMWNPSCKNNIEEEEAAALAKVRSMVIDEVPHPPLSGLTPPTPQVLIHVQRSNKDKNHDYEVRTKSGSHSYGGSHTYSFVGPIPILVVNPFPVCVYICRTLMMGTSPTLRACIG